MEITKREKRVLKNIAKLIEQEGYAAMLSMFLNPNYEHGPDTTWVPVISLIKKGALYTSLPTSHKLRHCHLLNLTEYGASLIAK